MLAWFNAENAKAFGTELADFYLARVQKAGTLARAKVTERKQRELVDKLTAKITVFKQQHRLNMYQKAQAGSAFKWQLKAAGLEDAVIEELTGWFIQNLGR